MISCYFESPLHNQIPKNEISPGCCSTMFHKARRYPYRNFCGLIIIPFLAKIYVLPDIMFEDLELTKSRKSEKLDAIPPFFGVHPYSAQFFLFLENVMLIY